MHKIKNGNLGLIKSFLAIFLAISFISGCNLVSQQNIPAVNSTPISIPTNTTAPIQPSETPSPVLPTATISPTAVPPTAIPAIAVPAGTTRINFATGATSGVVTGQIKSGETKNFVIGAAKDQPLMVMVNSLNNDVTFAITGLKDSTVLVPASQKLSSWETMLTSTQDYLIQIIGGASTEDFTLTVDTPARVNFDPGAISAQRKGTTPGGYIVSYVVRANANQKMSLKLTAPAGTAVLSVYGYQDGQPYLRYVAESTTFDFTLPTTEDYIIQVYPYAGQVANYTLDITIK